MSALMDFDQDNLLNVIRQLEQRVAQLEQGTVSVNTLGEMSDDLGDVRAGRFIAASTGVEPTDADFSGCFMSAAGEDFDSEMYHIGGVNAGSLQFGLDAETGKALAGGGNVILDENGLHIIEGTSGGKVGQYQPNGVVFFSSGTPVGEVYEYLSGSTGYRHLLIRIVNANDTNNKGIINLAVTNKSGAEVESLQIDGSTGIQSLTGIWQDGAILWVNTMHLYDGDGTPKTMSRLWDGTVFASGQMGYQASAANDDYFKGLVPLKAGTYTLKITLRKAPTAGRIDVYVDNVKLTTTGPFDMYAASATIDYYTKTGISITKNGAHEIKVKINGKNASSTDYYFYGCLIGIFPES